ncbi:unnamed protein product [Bemisia tabaci]|uniref:Cuticle protein 19 n=1 Tax=Bemisia tabaci TaxID=7038 RepID=A0A9P0G4S5_BEMTA|nr:PREDICTED: cuticle protein 19-like isoform X2 [Bemisia tabaci]CAH0769156.1 unnamed protein product [Bemisia tabaci]
MLFFQIGVLAMLILGAAATPLPGHAFGEEPDEETEQHPPSAYKFDYSIHDPNTNDIKSQWEHRDGDLVKGAYKLLEPDGSTRLVEYTADKDNGFHATVTREDGDREPQEPPSGSAFPSGLDDY